MSRMRYDQFQFIIQMIKFDEKVSPQLKKREGLDDGQELLLVVVDGVASTFQYVTDEVNGC